MKYELVTLAFIGAMVATIMGCDVEHSEQPQQQQSAQAVQPTIPMPDDERQFIDELGAINAKTHEQLNATNNGIRRDAIQEEAAKEECRALRSHQVVRNWVARLKRVDADSFAPDRASVELTAGDLEIDSESSLDPEAKGQPLKSWVKDLEPGQLVTFSGTIDLDLRNAVDRTDCNPIVSNPIYVEFKSMKVTPRT